VRNSQILIEAYPKGKRLESQSLAVAAYPGQCVTPSGAGTYGSGEFAWTPYACSADGDPRIVAVVLDDPQGGYVACNAGVAPANTPVNQYAIGARCPIYVPLPGDWINVLAAGEAGTGSANAFAFGARFIIQHNTGKLIVESTSSVSAPFVSMEHIDMTPDTDTLVFCMRN
jgi:hypothetical protein